MSEEKSEIEKLLEELEWKLFPKGGIEIIENDQVVKTWSPEPPRECPE